MVNDLPIHACRQLKLFVVFKYNFNTLHHELLQQCLNVYFSFLAYQ